MRFLAYKIVCSATARSCTLQLQLQSERISFFSAPWHIVRENARQRRSRRQYAVFKAALNGTVPLFSSFSSVFLSFFSRAGFHRFRCKTPFLRCNRDLIDHR